MKIALRPLHREGGYVLLLTLCFLAIMLAILASASRLTYTQVGITYRNNLHNSAVAAAEAATEMVIARMNRDFLHQSVNPDLDVYRSLTPESLQSEWPLQFEFGDGDGAPGVTGVESLGPAVVTNLNSQFAGLYGLVTPYRVTSTARTRDGLHTVAATVVQDIQLASIPVFQFAIFYTLDLEINPGPKMVVTGKVHSNGDIYTAPVSGLEYKDTVTAVGRIHHDRHPDDPQYGAGKVEPDYGAQHMEKVSALTLPVGTDNDPDTVREILKTPPVSEDPNSLMARQRYFNKADLIVKTTDSGVELYTGAWNLFGKIPPNVTNGSGPGYSFLKTDVTFRDLRENKWTTTTQIDVAAFNEWLRDPDGGAGINSMASYLMGHGINSIYVDDQRDSPSRLTCVRVVNGESLPPDGLTVATDRPLYVKGHFNLNDGDTTPGQTDTSKTKPASLVGDAITILSSAYNDNYAGSDFKNNRVAVDTTVNAAFLGGIVKTQRKGNAKYYSGGAENFPRFLENWSGRTFTYNGSMVVMFESKYATNFWKEPSDRNYYRAPNRAWAFDLNFLDQSKLPPGTPQVRKLVRGQWALAAPPGQ